jgi:hypothetical protein
LDRCGSEEKRQGRIDRGQVRRSEGVKAKSFFILFILATWSDLRTAGRAKDAGGRQLQGTAALLSLRRIYPAIFVSR